MHNPSIVSARIRRFIMNKPPNDDKKPKYPPPFSMRFTEDERRVLELMVAPWPLIKVADL